MVRSHFLQLESSGMRLVRVVLVVMLVATAGVFLAPVASATANAGPWDVTVRWRQDTVDTRLYFSVRMSTDADDDVTARYKACAYWTRTSDSVSSWTGPTLTATADEVEVQDQQSTPTGVLDSLAIILSGASGGCDNSANWLPIRARGDVTSVPGDQIEAMGSSILTSYPPADPLPAGTYPPEELPEPDPGCSRTLARVGGENVGTFRSEIEAVEGIDDAYEWDFGDSSTAATTADAQHVYPALSSQPAGGWTATMTLTRTGDGVAFEEGPATVECSLRVDFLNPEQSEAGTETMDEEEDADCPSGFGWLNPLAIARILKCLFVPADAGQDVETLLDQINGSVVGIVTVPIGALTGSWTALGVGADDTAGENGCEGFGVNIPALPSDNPAGLELHPLSTCDLGQTVGIVNVVLTAAIWIGAALAVLRLFGSLVGGPAPTRTEAEAT